MRHATRAAVVFVVACLAAIARAAPTVGVSGDLDAFSDAVTADRAARQALLDAGDKTQKKFVKAYNAVLAILVKPVTSASYAGEMNSAAKAAKTLDTRKITDAAIWTPLGDAADLYLTDLQTARTALAVLVPTLVGKPAKAAAKRLKSADKLLAKALLQSTLSATLPLYAKAAKLLLPVPGDKDPGVAKYAVKFAVDATGGFLYLVEPGDSTLGGSYVGAVRQMRIEADGSVSDLTPARVAAGTEPRAVASHPSGAFLYVANSADKTISQFAIGDDGQLSPRVPASVAVTGGGAGALAVDSTGHVLYCLGYTPGGTSLTAFTIGGDGRLTQQQQDFGAPYGAFVAPQPTNGGKTFVFMTGGGDGPSNPPELRTFQTSQAGELTFADVYYSPPDVSTVYLGAVLADPSRQVVYAARSSGTLVPFTIGETGTVTPLPGGSAATSGSSQAIVMNAAHDRIYLACARPDAVWAYSVAVDGSLAALSTPSVATPAPFDLALNPAGTRLYVLNGTATGTPSNVVSVFAVGQDGTLSSD